MKTISISGAIVSNDDKWIYDIFGIECTCPNQILSDLDSAKGEEVTIRINSGGGDIFAASDIYDAISSYNGKIKIKVVGVAASAASYIACAAESEIVPTGLLMIHNVKSMCKGDYKAFQHEAETMIKCNKAIATAYRLKTGMTEAELLELMDKESWLTSEEAVDKGFINEISKSNQQENKPLINNQMLVASMSNVLPVQVIEKCKNDRARAITNLNLLKLKYKE